MTGRLRTIAAGTGPVMLAAALLAFAPDSYRFLRESAWAAVSQWQAPPSSGEIVVVEIDAASAAELGNWPWPRSEIARLVNAIADSGGKAVALDMVLGGRCGEAENAALAEALGRVPATIGFVLPGADSDDAATSAVAVLPPAELPQLWQSGGAEMPCPVFAAPAQGIAAASLAGDLSATITTVPAIVAVGETLYPGLATDAVRLWTEAGTVMVGDGKDPVLRVGPLSAHLDSAAGLALHASGPGTWAGRSFAAKDILKNVHAGLKGKLVFIGSSLPQLGSLRPTAADPLEPSVQIQADIAESLLTGSVPWRPRFSPLIEGAITVIGALLIILAAIRLKPLLAAGATAAAAATAAAFAVIAQALSGLLFDPLLPPLSLVAVGVAAGLSQYAQSRKTESAMRRSFEQRLPPSVVARLSEGRGGQKIAGEERIVTALFTDIEGFTAMTGGVPAAALVKLLDGYFAGVTQAVSAHGGFVDKIVGDAAHAFFNMPDELTGHQGKALDCAAAIIAFAERYREMPGARAAGFGRTRIGIETGPAIAGDVGAEGKLDYSAHGSSVNLAARLQEANKITGTSILAGPGLVSSSPPGWRFDSLGRIDLRGFGAIEVFSPRRQQDDQIGMTPGGTAKGHEG